MYQAEFRVCWFIPKVHHQHPTHCVQVAYRLPAGHAIESVLMPYQELSPPSGDRDGKSDAAFGLTAPVVLSGSPIPSNPRFQWRGHVSTVGFQGEGRC